MFHGSERSKNEEPKRGQRKDETTSERLTSVCAHKENKKDRPQKSLKVFYRHGMGCAYHRFAPQRHYHINMKVGENNLPKAKDHSPRASKWKYANVVRATKRFCQYLVERVSPEKQTIFSHGSNVCTASDLATSVSQMELYLIYKGTTAKWLRWTPLTII